MEYFNHLKFFAEEMRKKRNEAGMSRAELAIKAGISLATISNLERGAANATFQALEAVAGCFKCPVTSMLTPDSDHEYAAFSMVTLIEDILRMDEKKLKKVAKYVAKVTT